MTPRVSQSNLPCKSIGEIYIEAKRCFPILELYDVTRNIDLIEVFKIPLERKRLYKNRKYRLLFCNDDNNPNKKWEYQVRIIQKVENKKIKLFDIDEQGVGQVFIRRNFRFEVFD